MRHLTPKIENVEMRHLTPKIPDPKNINSTDGRELACAHLAEAGDDLAGVGEC